jgi:hypothetical protein
MPVDTRFGRIHIQRCHNDNNNDIDPVFSSGITRIRQDVSRLSNGQNLELLMRGACMYKSYI